MQLVSDALAGDVQSLNGRSYVFPQMNPKYANALFQLLGYKDNDLIYSRFFYPKGHPKATDDKGRKLLKRLSLMDWKSIEVLQNEGRGSYFVVNGGGDTDAEVKSGRAIFCEWDDIDKDLQLTLWQNLGLPIPTIQIDTGGKSIHTYWIFDTPIAIAEWKSLQSDLLAFCRADTKLKNPSRVMRIPGCWHISANGNREMSKVVSMSGQKYTYDELREAIPKLQQQNPESNTSNWSEFTKNWTFPSTESIPLLSAIKREHRVLVESGCSTGSRNASGFALACDLIGTANFLRQNGQPFDGDEESLFFQYCSNCASDEGWAEPEWRSIFRSAQKGNKGSALSPEGIENCVKGAVWTQVKDSMPIARTEAKVSIPYDKPPEPTTRDKYLQLKTEIGSAIKIKSLAERNFTLQSLCSKYRINKQVLDLCKMEILSESDITQRRSYTFDEFFGLVKEDREWILPGILPRGDISIFIGSSGSGKSLHSYEAAFQVLIEGMFCDGFVPKGKVLFIQSDEGRASTLKRMLERGIANHKEMFRIMPRFTFNQMEALEQELIDFQPDLIIMDTLRDALNGTGIDENTAEAGNPLSDLKDLLKTYNCSTILIHYVNKKADAKGLMRCAGNIAIPAKAYSVYEFSQPTQNNQQEFKMISLKERDGAGVTYWHEYDESNGHWHLKFKMEEGSEAGEAGYSEKILNLFKVNLEKSNDVAFLGSEICTYTGTTPDRRKGVYMALNRLYQKGSLTRITIESTDSRPIYKYRVTDRQKDAWGMNQRNTVTIPSQSFVEQGFQDGNRGSNNIVTRQVTPLTSVQSMDNSVAINNECYSPVTTPVTIPDSSNINTSSYTVTESTTPPSTHTEPVKDAHPFGKPAYIERSPLEKFFDHKSRPIFYGSKVLWNDPPEQYKRMTDFTVEKIYKDTVKLAMINALVPHGQIEALKDISNGFRIGDVIQPNWKALNDAGRPIDQMIEAKEICSKGESITVTDFYRVKIQSLICEGLHAIDAYGYQYSIDPKFWEKVEC